MGYMLKRLALSLSSKTLVGIGSELLLGFHLGNKVVVAKHVVCSGVGICHYRNYSQLKVSEEGNVKKIVLDNVRSRNVLSLKMMQELNEAIKDIKSYIRCIVLRAEGKVFSAGHDLKELTAATGADYHHQVFDTCSQLMLGLTKCPVPILAEVNGVAAAAGCQLVASCDIVVASDKASFLTPGANAGIFCSTPGIPLIRNIPFKVAADMLLTGLPISAHQALNIGLVSVVVPEEQLEEETEKRVKAIMSKSRSVLALGKKFLYDQKQMNIEDAYREGSRLMVMNINMKDGQEGIRSFIEKRPPNWTHEE